jgi:DNA-binding protein YbaB
MGREIDEVWIEQAIERYRRIESVQAEFVKALKSTEVTVRSPDGLVEVLVNADGEVKDLHFVGADQRNPRELARSTQAAVTAAAAAATWARQKLHDEMFRDYQPLR